MDIHVLLVALMFVSFLALLFSGFPVAFVLGGVAMVFALIGEVLNSYGIMVDADLSFMGLVINRIYGIMASFSLVAVPMFIFMGIMLERTGVAANLLNAMKLCFSKVSGGLAIAVVLVGTILAASTGIIAASVVLLGTLALPVMLKDRYQPELALGTICAAGSLGSLVPPSVMLVLMADQMLISVGDLFMGAVIPGLLLASLYIVYIVVAAFLRPQIAPTQAGVDAGVSSVLMALKVARALLPPIFLIVAVLGSIFFGIASPTEAAGIGAAGAVLLAAAERRLDFSAIKEVSYTTAKMTSFIFALLLGATCFAVVLRGLGGDQLVEDALTGLPFGPYGVLGVILGVVFVLGFFIDWFEITFIVLPLIQPALPGLGIDPVWFTILVAICLQTSFLTPPVGFALFYIKGAAPPEITVAQIYRGIVPFVVIQVIAISVVIALPSLVTWLPSIAYR